MASRGSLVRGEWTRQVDGSSDGFNMLVTKYLARSDAIRTPLRDVKNSYTFSVMPINDFDCPRTSPDRSDHLTVEAWSPALANKVNYFLPVSEIVKAGKVGSTMCNRFFSTILRMAIDDYSKYKRPNAPQGHTRPNSVAFTDIVLYRRFHEAMAIMTIPLGLETRTYDIGDFRIPAALSHLIKPPVSRILTFCASTTCGDFGSHRLRCSRCKVAFYCNAAHRADDWKDGHKQECARIVEPQNRYTAMHRVHWA